MILTSRSLCSQAEGMLLDVKVVMSKSQQGKKHYSWISCTNLRYACLGQCLKLKHLKCIISKLIPLLQL